MYHPLDLEVRHYQVLLLFCQVELITKTEDAITGIRYKIEGGKEVTFEEIGAPEGTTFIVKNIFFNTPA